MLEHPQIDLQDELNNLIDFTNLLIEQNNSLALSAKASMMFALTLSARKVENHMAEIRRFLSQYVLDPYGIDYDNYIKKFQHLKSDWDNAVFGIVEDSVVDEEEEENEYSFAPNEVIADEDETLGIKENEDNEIINEARSILLDRMSGFYQQVSNSINEIVRSMVGINTDYKRLMQDEDRLEEKILQIRRIAIEEEEWQKFKEEFDDYCNYYLSKNGRNSLHLKNLTREWKKANISFAITDPYYRERCDEEIMRNRNEYLLQQYFYHIYYAKCCEILQSMVEEFIPNKIPSALMSREAKRIWKALCENGYVDTDMQLNDSSLTKQAILAEEISKRLFRGQDIKWALFEQLWGVKNLRTHNSKSLNKEYRRDVKDVIAEGTGKIKL